MPESVMTLFPNVLNTLETAKMPLQASLAFNQLQLQALNANVGTYKTTQDLILSLARQYSHLLPAGYFQNGDKLLQLCQNGAASLMDIFKHALSNQLNHFHQERAGELEFLARAS